MTVTGSIKLTYTKNPSRPSSLKIFPMELNTPLWRTRGTQGHQVPARSPPPGSGGEPPTPAQSHPALAGMGRGHPLSPGRSQVEMVTALVWG